MVGNAGEIASQKHVKYKKIIELIFKYWM